MSLTFFIYLFFDYALSADETPAVMMYGKLFQKDTSATTAERHL